ncbi:MAG: glutamate--cysteine ligase [Chromatiales bacterium]|nr:glutamate--cysteine ligase [Chromatiales bacterium]
MSEPFEARLRRLSAAGAVQLLPGGRRGVEKESLRITPRGFIAHTPHPRGLGSALTSQYITTDFSEALLEFVTPPLEDNEAALHFLHEIHRFTYHNLGEELLWPLSMPCRIRDEEDIPLAEYGSSNVARMKTTYRRGLGYRYGRFMQAISGIHFNYSVPPEFWPAWHALEGVEVDLLDFQSAAYLGLVRNVRRLDWLLLYLFGASPAVCRCFLQGRGPELDELDPGTVHGPWATSLRMSDLGYQNRNQADLRISANSLDEYVNDLVGATSRLRPEFAAIGVCVDGDYRQLNANALQIENEYYSTIRPKRVARSGERPTDALRRGGVEYVELRALDVSPFEPGGIGVGQMQFLEVFLLYCLLQDSPPISLQEHEVLERNHAEVARNGRNPAARLVRDGQLVTPASWGDEVIDCMLALAGLLDEAGGDGFAMAVRAQRPLLSDPALTPSARLTDELLTRRAELADFGLALAAATRDHFLAGEADPVTLRLLEEESRRSLERQALIEAGPQPPFEQYLADYFGQPA